MPVKARKAIRPPIMPTIIVRFNGAVPVKARKVADAFDRGLQTPGFNGAVPVKARKVLNGSFSRRVSMLQWGRAC